MDLRKQALCERFMVMLPLRMRGSGGYGSRSRPEVTDKMTGGRGTPQYEPSNDLGGRRTWKRARHPSGFGPRASVALRGRLPVMSVATGKKGSYSNSQCAAIKSGTPGGGVGMPIHEHLCQLLGSCAHTRARYRLFMIGAH